MRSEKEKQILDFVEKHSGAPLQRTPAWISLRRSVIGASELAALVGMSPYGNFQSVALKKIRTCSSSFSSPACSWRTIFEDVAVKLAERKFMTKIYGNNICVLPHEGSPLHEKHVVSPDGYGVVEFAKQKKNWALLCNPGAWQFEPGSRTPMVALFEFKCPYRRHPKGFVPRYYLPQVWAGLDISPVANIGLNCEMVARKCSKAEFHAWGSFDKSYHLNYHWGHEISWGVSGVFRREASDGLIDYGAASSEGFDEMMKDVVDGQECRIVHSPLFASNLSDIDGPEGFVMEGFFYWKILRFETHIVKRNSGFMEKCTPLICECLEYNPHELNEP